MSIKFNVLENDQGKLKCLTIVIGCFGNDKEIYSCGIVIDDLATVQFRFIAKFPWNIECMFKVRNQSTDCPIKVKIYSKEMNYLSERIYSDTDKDNWNSMGEHSNKLLTFNDGYIHQFTVSISASKLESSIHEKIYNDGDFTDFRLCTAEGGVAIHKAVLAASSDMFKTMLSREWKETAEGRMKIEGITLQTLQHLKQYMYLGTLPEDGLLPLLSIASCYLMDTLKTECLEKLTQNVKPEDLYDLLDYSVENKVPELRFALMKVPESVVLEAEKLRVQKSVEQNPKEE